MNYSHIQRIKYICGKSKALHKIGRNRYFSFDLDVTLNLICDLDLINDL